MASKPSGFCISMPRKVRPTICWRPCSCNRNSMCRPCAAPCKFSSIVIRLCAPRFPRTTATRSKTFAMTTKSPWKSWMPVTGIGMKCDTKSNRTQSGPLIWKAARYSGPACLRLPPGNTFCCSPCTTLPAMLRPSRSCSMNCSCYTRRKQPDKPLSYPRYPRLMQIMCAGRGTCWQGRKASDWLPTGSSNWLARYRSSICQPIDPVSQCRATKGPPIPSRCLRN